jgi:hypothetical protein
MASGMDRDGVVSSFIRFIYSNFICPPGVGFQGDPKVGVLEREWFISKSYRHICEGGGNGKIIGKW